MFEASAVRERLLDVHEVAEYLGVSVRTVWGLRASGHFAPATKIGKRCVWREVVIRKWLEDSTEAPGESATYPRKGA